MTKCWGGPLDGRDAPFEPAAAFPWPRGWYYYSLSQGYRWREGRYTSADEAWLKERGVHSEEAQ